MSFVRSEQGMGGDQGVILSVSYVEEWFFVVNYFQNTEEWGIY